MKEYPQKSTVGNLAGDDSYKLLYYGRILFPQCIND